MKIINITIIIILLISSIGCVKVVEEPIPVERKYELASQPQAQPRTNRQSYSPPVIEPPKSNRDLQTRFTESEQDSRTAVERALEWSEKYEQLSTKTESLREQNTQLQMQNSQLKMEASRLKIELQQANKELSEANAFLQEMQLELTNWKSEVLGHREEIRKAHKAQLKALTMILKVLGAETVDIQTEQTEEN